MYRESYTDSCGENVYKLKDIVRKSTCHEHATHIITEIVYGAHVLVILQLPSDHEKEIDTLLIRLLHALQNNRDDVKLSFEERTLLDQIKSTKKRRRSTFQK